MKTHTLEEMKDMTWKFGVKVTAFDNAGATNYQVDYWRKRSGPMTESELHWFLRGFMAAKGLL